MSTVEYIGNQPIYNQPVTYVEYTLPFRRYWIKTPFGSGEINVSLTFLEYYDEHLAVALTAWGNMREKFRLYDTAPKRNEMRDAFIKQLEFERRF